MLFKYILYTIYFCIPIGKLSILPSLIVVQVIRSAQSFSRFYPAFSFQTESNGANKGRIGSLLCVGIPSRAED